MTSQRWDKFAIVIVAASALTEAARLLWRLPRGTVGHEVVWVQMTLLFFLLLRAAVTPRLRTTPPSPEQVQVSGAAYYAWQANVLNERQATPLRWRTFYIMALASLLMDSLWNLCLFL